MKKIKILFCCIFIFINYILFVVSLSVLMLYLAIDNQNIQKILNTNLLKKYDASINFRKISIAFSKHKFNLILKSTNLKIKKDFQIKIKKVKIKFVPFKVEEIQIVKPLIYIKKTIKIKKKGKSSISSSLFFLLNKITLKQGKINYLNKIQIDINGRYNRPLKKAWFDFSLNKNRFNLLICFKDKLFFYLTGTNLTPIVFKPSRTSVTMDLNNALLKVWGTCSYDFKNIILKTILSCKKLLLTRERKNLVLDDFSISVDLMKKNKILSFLGSMFSSKINSNIIFLGLLKKDFLILKGKIEDLSLHKIKTIWQWTGENNIYNKIFSIYKDGTLKETIVVYKGNYKDKNILKKLKFHINICNSLIEIPKIKNLLLSNVNGTLVYYNKKLNLINLTGNVNSSIIKLSNSYIIFKKPVEIKIFSNFQCNYQSIKNILQNNLKNKFIKIERLFSKIDGNATGKFSLFKNKSFDLKLKLKTFSAKILPINFDHEIKIKGQDGFYHFKDIFYINKLKVFTKNSKIEESSFRLSLKQSSFLDYILEIKKSLLRINDFAFLKPCNKIFDSMHGTLILNNFKSHGNLKDFNSISYKTKIYLKNALFRVKSIDHIFNIPYGEFTLNNFLLNIERLNLNFINSNLIFKGKFFNLYKIKKGFSLSITGHVSDNLTNFLFTKYKLPTLFLLNPFDIKTLNLNYSDNKINTAGVLLFKKNKDDIAISFKYNSKFDFNILKNNNFIAHIKIEKYKDKINFLLNGKINKKILKIVFKNDFLLTDIKGNIDIHFKQNPLTILKCNGELSLNDFVLKLDKTIHISRLNLYGKNSILNFKGKFLLNNRSDILIQKAYWDLKKNKIYIAIFSNLLNYDDLEFLFNLKADNKKSIKFNKPSSFDLSGKIKSILYKKYKLCLCDLNVKFDKNRFLIDFKNINFCNIPLKGKIDLKKSYASFSSNTKDIKFGNFLKCVSKNKKKIITGNMKIKLNITSPLTDFYKNLKGEVNIKLKKGRIYKLNLLMKIFALLNSTEIFFGKAPDLEKKGMGYDYIYIKCVIKEGKAKIVQGMVNGKSLEIFFNGDYDLLTDKINFLVFICPLKTIDRILKHIPLLNKITGGNVISIPFQIVGKYKKPIIIPISPKAVSSQILRFFKRIIKAPVLIFQPFEQEQKY